MFQINEYKEAEAEREVILEKIVSDPLQNNGLISFDKVTEELALEIDVSEHYITNIGDPSNLYHIDDNNVLWGCGKNQYGQLGQGTKDEEFHEDMVKIAENVIHVDYSQKGFLIYLTKDKKLYGLGNGASGTMAQFASYSEEVFYSYDEYSVTSPKLLLEDVEYARCGRSDIVAMKTDDSIWVWGLIWCRNAQTFCYQGWPVKVLENGALVTGSFYNHAALLNDGSVWTWGYNYSGNCGVEAMPEISTPQKVAENVVMVWTGSIEENVEYNNIDEFGGEYPRDMENTIIQKDDGSYWICGANVGKTSKVLPIYYEISEHEMVCSYKFVPYNKVLIGDE